MFNHMHAGMHHIPRFFLIVTDFITNLISIRIKFQFENEKSYARFNMNIKFFFQLCETCQIILVSKVPKIVQFDKSRQYVHVLDYVLQEIRLMIEKARKLKYLKLPRFPTHFQQLVYGFNKTLVVVVAHPFDILVMNSYTLLQLVHKLTMLFSIVDSST